MDLSNYSSVEVQDIAINLNDEQLTIINIYYHLNQHISQEWYNKLSQIFNKYKNTFIIGDFNAHPLLLQIRLSRQGTSKHGRCKWSLHYGSYPTLLTSLETNKSVLISPYFCRFDATMWNHYWIGHLWQWSLLLSTCLFIQINPTDKADKLYHYLLSTSEEFFSKVSINSTEAWKIFCRSFTKPYKIALPRKTLTSQDSPVSQ